MAKSRKKYTLVLQFKEAYVDYDQLIALENALRARLHLIDTVDGHDMGSGQSNIFIFTDQPQEAFTRAKLAIDEHGIPTVKAAFRTRDSPYTILWPPGATEFKVT